MTKLTAQVSWPEKDQADAITPLTAQQARQWRQMHPQGSLWWVIAGQALVGCVVTLVIWAYSGQAALAWSAGYGSLAVVLPAALLGWRLTRQNASAPGSVIAGFFLWEMVKLAVSVAMLVAAPRLVSKLDWLALLAGLVLTMKAYWVAVVFAPKRTKHVTKHMDE